MMTNFFDFINDPDIYEELQEFLQPTNQIISDMKEFTKDTVLENITAVVDQKDDNTLILRYYTTQQLTEKTRKEIEDKQHIIDSLDIPFNILVEVYQPYHMPSITIRRFIDE